MAGAVLSNGAGSPRGWEAKYYCATLRGILFHGIFGASMLVSVLVAQLRLFKAEGECLTQATRFDRMAFFFQSMYFCTPWLKLLLGKQHSFGLGFNGRVNDLFQFTGWAKLTNQFYPNHKEVEISDLF